MTNGLNIGSVGGDLTAQDITAGDKVTTTTVNQIPPECLDEWRKLVADFEREPTEAKSQGVADYAISYMADVSKNILAGALMQMPTILRGFMK